MTDKLIEPFILIFTDNNGKEIRCVKESDYSRLQTELLAKDAEIERVKNISVEDMAIEMTIRVKPLTTRIG